MSAQDFSLPRVPAILFARPRSRGLGLSLFFLSLGILAVNQGLNLASPTTMDFSDDFTLLDFSWRAFQGQHVGIDFHDPLGFGPAEIAALLWRLFGTRIDAVRHADFLLGLVIVGAGCFVAGRNLAQRRVLAVLFCVTLAFAVVSPSIYGWSPKWLGLGESYDRLLVGSLSVLFLLAFTGLPSQRRAALADALIAALLLDILFLVKISGPILGLGVLFGGCLAQERPVRRLLWLVLAVAVFGALVMAEFYAAGLSVIPVFREYAATAAARIVRPRSELLVAAEVLEPIIGLLLILAFLGRVRDWKFWRSAGFIVTTYAVLQFLLNLTDNTQPIFTTAPAAAIALVALDGRRERLPRHLHPSRLGMLSLREAIPLAIFAYALIPEIKGTLFAVLVVTLVALGVETPVTVASGAGPMLRMLPFGAEHDSVDYALSLDDGVRALKEIGLSDERVADLDYTDPFPFLLQAPSPRGVRTWWTPGQNVPADYVADLGEIVGNACVLMVPERPVGPELAPLFARARARIEDQFVPIYRDAWWQIYRRQPEGSACLSARPKAD